MRMTWGVVVALAAACGSDGVAMPDASVADASPDAARRNVGLFLIFESPIMNTTAYLGVFSANVDSVIATREDGPCTIEQTRPNTQPRQSAGTITVAGGAASPVTIPFDPVESYFAMTSGLVYAANDQLTITATGAAVPAFSGQLAFPATVSLTSGSPTSLR